LQGVYIVRIEYSSLLRNPAFSYPSPILCVFVGVYVIGSKHSGLGFNTGIALGCPPVYARVPQSVGLFPPDFTPEFTNLPFTVYEEFSGVAKPDRSRVFADPVRDESVCFPSVVRDVHPDFI
jgi:hypothetical protein